jgi:hypothetical protein
MRRGLFAFAYTFYAYPRGDPQGAGACIFKSTRSLTVAARLVRGYGLVLPHHGLQ